MPSTSTIAATEKSLEILEIVSNADGASISDLVEITGYCRGTVHRHLSTLREHDLLTKVGPNYYVSVAILTYGGEARSRYPLHFNTHDELNELAEKHDALVQVGVQEANYCVYIYQMGREYSSLSHSSLGARVDFHSSATGKALLSTFPEEERDERIDDLEWRRHTPNTSTDPDELTEAVESAGSELIAFDFEEQFRGVSCVATPLEFKGAAAALSASIPASDDSESYLKEELADDVYRIGRVLEMDATYEDWGIEI
jgi:DNA-binding IclR family transcriptional regulator